MTGSEWAALRFVATAMDFTPGSNTPLAAALEGNLGLRRALCFVLGMPMGWPAVARA